MSGIKEILTIIQSEQRKAVLEHEAKMILRKMGIIVPPSTLVKTKEEAIEAAAKFGYPVVMKLMSVEVIHKTDYDAVVLNLRSEEEVKSTFDDFMNRFSSVDVAGVLVEKMVGKGLELIIGTNTDPTFGPVILFGVGGVMVEAIKDVVFRLCPTTQPQALQAIEEIKARVLLDGFRGMPKVNKEELSNLIVKLSELAWEYKEYIAEMDINPIIANEDGLFPVDARIILK
ncbi:MAG: acetyl-CoA synthetase [Candidatus Heimdallarchaeota archaeon]|nr:MAG: acetyl-CoA synthetase [Candidatus Heimdallarchaeota archaeon]